MSDRFGTILKGFLGVSLGALVVLLIVVYLGELNFFTPMLAYLLSFVFVGSNFIVIYKIVDLSESKFYKPFFISIAVRFVLVIIALIFVLKAIKINQIYFTVSFIISYILHSIIEIISINKILETDK